MKRITKSASLVFAVIILCGACSQNKVTRTAEYAQCCLDPFGMLVGAAIAVPIAAVAITADSLSKSGGIPPTRPLTPDEVSRIKADWEQRKVNAKNEGKPVPSLDDVFIEYRIENKIYGMGITEKQVIEHYKNKGLDPPPEFMSRDSKTKGD